MAKELNKILEDMKKGTAEERIDALSDIIEDMMQLVLTIPGIFDDIMNQVSEKISGLESKLQQFEQANRVKVDAKKEFLEQISSSTSTSQPKPPPPSPPKTVQEANKVEYKGANTKRMIMSELKELFKKKEDLDKNAIEEKKRKELEEKKKKELEAKRTSNY